MIYGIEFKYQDFTNKFLSILFLVFRLGCVINYLKTFEYRHIMSCCLSFQKLYIACFLVELKSCSNIIIFFKKIKTMLILKNIVEVDVVIQQNTVIDQTQG